MEEELIPLTLDQAQGAQLFAHLFTYLFFLVMTPAGPKDQEELALIHEVAYRLHQFYLNPAEQVFGLSRKELTTVSATLRRLQPLYEQDPRAEPYAFVLEHLSACLSLLQQAEQHAGRSEESRGRE